MSIPPRDATTSVITAIARIAFDETGPTVLIIAIDIDKDSNSTDNASAAPNVDSIGNPASR